MTTSTRTRYHTTRLSERAKLKEGRVDTMFDVRTTPSPGRVLPSLLSRAIRALGLALPARTSTRHTGRGGGAWGVVALSRRERDDAGGRRPPSRDRAQALGLEQGSSRERERAESDGDHRDVQRRPRETTCSIHGPGARERGRGETRYRAPARRGKAAACALLGLGQGIGEACRGDG